MKYPSSMDKECINLCDQLNSLKGVKTFESCCGHYKQPYVIFMTISSFYSLSLLARAFDTRYSSGKWAIKVSSCDIPRKKSGVATFELRTTITPKNEKQMMKLVNEAINNIKWWKQPKYEEHLKGINIIL